jgi:hypothetical protein
MAIRDTEILSTLQANYQKTLALMTPELAQEFQRRIITPDDLKRFASAILVAIQMKNVTGCLNIQNQIIDQFNFRGFGTKLKQKGIDPVKCYEQLLQGFFDYK